MVIMIMVIKYIQYGEENRIISSQPHKIVHVFHNQFKIIGGFDRHTSPQGLVKIRLFQKLSSYLKNHLKK